tara:strand:+ start:1896 stop:2147 length:252 start_codon:yes stop_codon:yes gene_type:complete
MGNRFEAHDRQSPEQLAKSKESNYNTANEHISKEKEYNSPEAVAERGYHDTSAYKTASQAIQNIKDISERDGTAEAERSWWNS